MSPKQTLYGQLLLNKGTKKPFNGERTDFSKNGAGTHGYPYEKRMKQDPYLTIYIKIKLSHRLKYKT